MQTALKPVQEISGTGDGDGFNDAIFHALLKHVEIVSNDFGVFAGWQAMARKDLSDNAFIITNGIGVPVAGKISQAIALFKEREENVFFGACKFEQNAIDVKNYGCINH